MKSVLLGGIVALTFLAGCESNASDQSSNEVKPEAVTDSIIPEKKSEKKAVSKIHYDSNGIIVCEENDIGVCVDGVLQNLRAAQLREQHYTGAITPLEESIVFDNDNNYVYEYNNGTGAYATEFNDPLTPEQAARLDYLLGQDMVISERMIESLNDFTLNGGENNLRQFVIERSNYNDGYNALEDCRNPDLTETEYFNTCT